MRGAVAALALGLADESNVAAPGWARDWIAQDDQAATVARVQAHRIVDVTMKVLRKNGIETRLIAGLESQARQERLLAMVKAVALHRALDALEAASVPVLVIKGTALAAQISGDWANRRSVDVDLFIDSTDIYASMTALEGAGFRRNAWFAPEPESPLFAQAATWLQEMTFFGHRCTIDVHWRLDPSKGCLTWNFTTAWDRREEVNVAGRAVPTLTPVDAALFNAVHGGKDCWGSLHQISDQVRLQLLVEKTADEWMESAEASACRVRWMLAQEMIAPLTASLPRTPDSVRNSVSRRGESRVRFLCGKMWQGLAADKSPGSYGSMAQQARYLAFNLTSYDNASAAARRMGVVAWPVQEMAAESLGRFGTRHSWAYPATVPVHVPRRMLAKARRETLPQRESLIDRSEERVKLDSWDVRRIGGVDIALAPAKDAITMLLAEADLRAVTNRSEPEANKSVPGGLAVHFANAYTISLASVDHAYADLLNRSDCLVMADGRPVVWAASRIDRSQTTVAKRWEQVCGPETMPEILRLSEATDISHYFLGGSVATLAALVAQVRRRYPGVRVAGFESPPFREMTSAEQQAQDDRIRDSGAAIVWVGLGTPKQDWEVARIAQRLPVVAMAVGAAFDFQAGTKPEAPTWVRRWGLEWAFRWMSEPRRLTGRYVVGNARFLRTVVSTAWCCRV